MTLLRVLMFVVFALAAYGGTVAAAFAWWEFAGAAGRSETALMLVLFLIAPAVAIPCGALMSRHLVPAAPAAPKADGREGGHGPYAAPPSARAQRAWHLGIAIGGALLVLAVLLWLDHTPHSAYIPRLSVR